MGGDGRRLTGFMDCPVTAWTIHDLWSALACSGRPVRIQSSTS